MQPIFVRGLSLERREQRERIMSRTRNTITLARGTIAENARRQLALMRSGYARLLPSGRKDRMPGTMRKNDWCHMGHRI